ncbi:MAG: hypothetical protein PHV08_06855 [Sulfurovaceae bacterium]|nr:hypothetical protein [Sulfurovaceae bacterium]
MSQMHILLTLHVISAIIWVGGMIAVRVAVHPIKLAWEDEELRINRNLAVTKRLLFLALPFVIISIATGIMLSAALKNTSLDYLIHVKETIWLIMAFNFIWIFLRRNVAQRAFNNLDLLGTKKVMMPLANFFLPLNIILGLAALWLGVALRGV